MFDDKTSKDAGVRPSQLVDIKQDLLLPDEEEQIGQRGISLDDCKRGGPRHRGKPVVWLIITAVMAIGLGFAVGYFVVKAARARHGRTD